jgi:hypothetical protein
MKLIFEVQIFAILNICFLSCNSQESSGSGQIQDGDIKISPKVVSAFNEDEIKLLDSIKLYKLENCYETCIKYLYLVNGRKFFRDDLYCKLNNQPVFSCNIRIRGFTFRSEDTRDLIFGVFIRDTIPCRVSMKIDGENIINGFSVSIKTGQIKNALAGENSTIPIETIKKMADSVYGSTEFNALLIDSTHLLHDKLRNIFNRTNIDSPKILH